MPTSRRHDIQQIQEYNAETETEHCAMEEEALESRGQGVEGREGVEEEPDSQEYKAEEKQEVALEEREKTAMEGWMHTWEIAAQEKVEPDAHDEQEPDAHDEQEPDAHECEHWAEGQRQESRGVKESMGSRREQRGVRCP